MVTPLLGGGSLQNPESFPVYPPHFSRVCACVCVGGGFQLISASVFFILKLNIFSAHTKFTFMSGPINSCLLLKLTMFSGNPKNFLGPMVSWSDTFSTPGSDVDILCRCCLEFRELFHEITDIDPFRTITIVSACHKVYRSKYLLKDTIAIIPPMGCTPKAKQSLIAHKWLSYLSEKNDVYIQHARDGGEKRVGDYWLDQPEPRLGNYIGDLTDELGGDHITMFASGGPKNYCYKTSGDKTDIKVRGITLDCTAQQKVNFKSMCALVFIRAECGVTGQVSVDIPFSITRQDITLWILI